jgi:hypothetical protein
MSANGILSAHRSLKQIPPRIRGGEPRSIRTINNLTIQSTHISCAFFYYISLEKNVKYKMSATAGILLVHSSAAKSLSSTFTEDKYNEWYTDHHIHHVVDSGLSDLAIRYKNTNPDAKWPYICIYRIPDLAKMADESVTGNIATTHELLPDGKTWMDVLDVERRIFKVIQKFEPGWKTDDGEFSLKPCVR